MSQLDLFGNSPSAMPSNSFEEHKKIPNGEYLYVPNFFPKHESDAYFKTLLNEIQWKQEGMKMYGKYVQFPRLMAWYGSSGKRYSFFGLTFNPEEWTKELLAIKNAIEAKANLDFNSVLLNLYRSGSDSMSWHQDNERELGRNPVIASVSFGGKRNFQLRHKTTKQKINIELTHGSLLIMLGETQHFWQHQIPKTKRKVKPRINLTFRVIK